MTPEERNDLALEVLEVTYIIGLLTDFYNAVSALIANDSTRVTGRLVYEKSMDNHYNTLNDINNRLDEVASRLFGEDDKEG